MSEPSLTLIRDRIAEALKKSAAGVSEVSLIAVSKTRSVEEIDKVIRQGVVSFGENKLQEAEAKIETIGHQVQWHFIGRIQSNKIGRIFSLFDMVQSVDRIGVLSKAQHFLSGKGICRQVLLQVNMAEEPQKAGFTAAFIDDFFRNRHQDNFPNLQIKGLMCIGPHTDDRTAVKQCFLKTRELFEVCNAMGAGLEYCSMGMSDDFELAIEAGSNMVRIGSAIFGPRV